MTQTDVTQSLLQKYKETERKSSFREELQVLLNNKYHPDKNFTDEDANLLEEYEKYFTWTENYNFDFYADWYIEGDHKVRVTVDSLDEFLELINKDDEDIENSFEENEKLSDAIDSMKYDGDLYIECNYTSLRNKNISVWGLEPKKVVETSPTKDDEVLKNIFENLNDIQKQILVNSQRDQLLTVFTQMVDSWKSEKQGGQN